MSFDVSSLGELYPWTPQRFTLPSGHSMSYLDVGPASGAGDAPAPERAPPRRASGG